MRDEIDELEAIVAQESPDPGEGLLSKMIEELTVTDTEAAQFCDPNWAYENMFIEGHICVIAAEPGAGKTAITFYCCQAMAAKGYEVLYINADIAASDVNYMRDIAQKTGVHLLLPDMKGTSMQNVRAMLEEIAVADEDLTRRVIVIDTLKKIGSVMQKQSVAPLFCLFRRLCAKGATIIVLGHTNKHYNAEGLPDFEGVGDIKNDPDELIYLIPKDKPDGTKLVSTVPDKVRGEFKPITFELGKDRSVRLLSRYQDLRVVKKREAQYEKDREGIEEILEVLRSGSKTQNEITMAITLGRNLTRRLLKRYSGDFWSAEKGDNNAWIYSAYAVRKGG